jgi:lipopolysaccharide transport system ATP-binding protein
MRQMIESGVTVLFVSHDTGTVRSLCQKCLFLERGTMVRFGKTSEVVDAYDAQMNLSLNAELKTGVEIKPPPQNVVATPQETKQTDIKDIRVSSSDEAHQFAKGYQQYGEGGASILDVKLLNSRHQVTDQLETYEPFIIQFSVLFNRDMENYAVGYSIQDVKGLRMLGGMTTSYPEYSPPKATKGDIYVFEIRGINVLTQDIYTLSMFVEIPVLINERHFVEGAIENAIVFRSKFPADRTSWIYSRVFTPVEFAHAKAPA